MKVYSCYENVLILGRGVLLTQKVSRSCHSVPIYWPWQQCVTNHFQCRNQHQFSRLKNKWNKMNCNILLFEHLLGALNLSRTCFMFHSDYWELWVKHVCNKHQSLQKCCFEARAHETLMETNRKRGPLIILNMKLAERTTYSNNCLKKKEQSVWKMVFLMLNVNNLRTDLFP